MGEFHQDPPQSQPNAMFKFGGWVNCFREKNSISLVELCLCVCVFLFLSFVCLFLVSI